MRCFWMDYILAVIFPCCYQSLVYPNEVFLNGFYCYHSLIYPNEVFLNGFYCYQSLIYPNEVFLNGFYSYQSLIYSDEVFLNGFYCYQSLVYPNEVFLNGLHLGHHLYLLLIKSGLSKWVVKGLELGCHPLLPQCWEDKNWQCHVTVSPDVFSLMGGGGRRGGGVSSAGDVL